MNGDSKRLLNYQINYSDSDLTDLAQGTVNAVANATGNVTGNMHAGDEITSD